MSDKQTPDRKGASPSAPRRVEKVGEAQLIEDSAGRLAITVPIRIKQRGRTQAGDTARRRVDGFQNPRINGEGISQEFSSQAAISGDR